MLSARVNRGIIPQKPPGNQTPTHPLSPIAKNALFFLTSARHPHVFPASEPGPPLVARNKAYENMAIENSDKKRHSSATLPRCPAVLWSNSAMLFFCVDFPYLEKKYIGMNKYDRVFFYCRLGFCALGYPLIADIRLYFLSVLIQLF